MRNLFYNTVLALLALFSGIGFVASAQSDTAMQIASQSMEQSKQVYVFPIHEQIMPSTVRLTEKCLNEADLLGADYVIIDMNTYGGLVEAADSVRTRILNYPKPVYVFVNNQAISAGALIAIAADRIYMREGASIGAATVVDQSGEQMPDKYQSFMRGMMRATAESHGRVVERVEGQDTLWRWVRDPLVAEAMVDASVEIEGLIGADKVLTFSAREAVEWGYCEGVASSVEQIMAEAGVENYETHTYTPTFTDKLMGILTSPLFQGLMIMLIVGGIYFELQTPGVGFPLVAAIVGAVIYFAPLYVEGLLANWELILFIVGVILILLEIFVTPGFGILGIAGISAVVLGLAFAMVDSQLFKYVPTGEVSVLVFVKPLGVVIIAATAALIASIWLGKRLLTGGSRLGERVVLNSTMDADAGYVSHMERAQLVGRSGVTTTHLRPSGRVLIDQQIYEAVADNGQFVEKGKVVRVAKYEGGVLYCAEE